MGEVAVLRAWDQPGCRIAATVEAAYQPLIRAEIARIRALGEAARAEAINAVLSKIDRSPTGWAALTREERSEEMKRRWVVRKANAGARKRSRRRVRQAEDFYPSPPDVTHALLTVEGDRLTSFPQISEPACGDGAISKVLEEAGMKVQSSDLIDRGFGEVGLDFLATDSLQSRAVVTNPPFSLAREFIRHSLVDLQVDYLALFLQATFFQSAVNASLFEAHPPSAIYPLTWVPKFRSDGNFIKFAWFVWDRQRPGERRVQPIGRKGASSTAWPRFSADKGGKS